MHITHDIHTHTLHSSCCLDPEATVKAYISRAQELGHTVLGISNHLWDEHVPGSNSWYRGQTLRYVLDAKASIPADCGDLKVLFGAEAEYCAMTETLAMRAEDANGFDYILIPHTHTHMKNFVIPEFPPVKERRTEYQAKMKAYFPELTDAQISKMCDALTHNDLYPAVAEGTDYPGYLSAFVLDSFESLLNHPEFRKLAHTLPVIIAHPFSPHEGAVIAAEAERRIDTERLRALCEQAAGMGLAFDINMRVYHFPENGYSDDPMVHIMRIAKEAGVRFACGTDAHSVKALDDIRKADAICSAIGLQKQDLWEPVR